MILGSNGFGRKNRGEYPDWKQWMPVYGIYQIQKNVKNNKPTIFYNSKNPKNSDGYAEATIAIYHAVSLAPTFSGLL